MNKIFGFLAGAGTILLVGSLFYHFNHQQSSETYKISTLQIGNQQVLVEISDTPALRELGLGGRKGLAEGRGMLFVFDISGKYGFWMKGMSFPIDIIWADQNTVVNIAQSVSPSTYPQVFYPQSNTKFVLEVPAGFAARHDIKIGSNFSIGH